MKILCLGNEFIKQDSLAKKIGENLKNSQENIEIINIKDSFELLNYLQIKGSSQDPQDNQNLIILDVVENLTKPQLIKIDDLKQNKIISAHDFDASFFLKLIKTNIKIIGIPMEGDINKLSEDVIELLK